MVREIRPAFLGAEPPPVMDGPAAPWPATIDELRGRVFGEISAMEERSSNAARERLAAQAALGAAGYRPRGFSFDFGRIASAVFRGAFGGQPPAPPTSGEGDMTPSTKDPLDSTTVQAALRTVLVAIATLAAMLGFDFLESGTIESIVGVVGVGWIVINQVGVILGRVRVGDLARAA